MRFYFIFGITFIMCLLILLWDPSKKYLGIYDDDIIIENLEVVDGYHWEYVADDSLNVKILGNNKWKITSNKSGNSKIVFNLVSDENSNDINYSIDYGFKFKFNRFYWISGICSDYKFFPNPY